MKKLIAVLLIAFSFAAQAQTFTQSVDSNEIYSAQKVTITLKAEYHFLIIDCLNDIKSPILANYVAQVAKYSDTAYNPSKQITVTATLGLIKDIYFLMGAQQERLLSGTNDELKAALLPQIFTHSWLIGELQKIDAENAALRQAKKDRGFQLVKQMKV